MVRRQFVGPLPKGTTKKEERIFRQTGITVRKPLVKRIKKVRTKKGKQIKVPKRLITGVEKAFEFELPKETKLTREQVVKKLMGRKEKTLLKIVESPTASPMAKMRAKRLLGI